MSEFKFNLQYYSSLLLFTVVIWLAVLLLLFLGYTFVFWETPEVSATLLRGSFTWVLLTIGAICWAGDLKGTLRKAYTQ